MATPEPAPITLYVTPVRLAGWTAVEMYKGPLDGTRVIVLQLDGLTPGTAAIGKVALPLEHAIALRDTLATAIAAELLLAQQPESQDL